MELASKVYGQRQPLKIKTRIHSVISYSEANTSS
jgi:hypothetical protein